jgi:hypothetical protein
MHLVGNNSKKDQVPWPDIDSASIYHSLLPINTPRTLLATQVVLLKFEETAEYLVLLLGIFRRAPAILLLHLKKNVVVFLVIYDTSFIREPPKVS